ncbi:MAG: ABC transporter permease [Rhodospirillales bacterium]|nr:ABC transporter permease [Rhodospirillales bacterium]
MSARDAAGAGPLVSLGSIFRIAARNLLRYRRRTLLTTLLVVIGVMSVLLFMALSGSFRALMVGQITDSMLGHLQVHRKGFLASVESLPLNMNMKPKLVERLEAELAARDDVAAFAPRLKFGAMFSNFTETSNIRITAVSPEREAIVVPLLPSRFAEGKPEGGLVVPGSILVPELLARGMKVKVGDEVVLVATNQDGSVNGRTFRVQGILESMTGPGGRDGYIHLDDARTLLRMKEPEVSEFAIRLKDPSRAMTFTKELDRELAEIKNPQGKPAFEVHGWQELTPFYNILRIIDIMTLAIQFVLVSIVLVSVMNVMMMAVFERVREIGTIAAIGTQPRTILALFLSEGLLLGLVGAGTGALLSVAVVFVLNTVKVAFSFGREDLVLAPTISPESVLVVAAVVVGVAVLASLQPAWKAARMDPNTALRHV